MVAVACFSQWIGKTDRVFLLAKAKRKERQRLHRTGFTTIDGSNLAIRGGRVAICPAATSRDCHGSRQMMDEQEKTPRGGRV